MINIPFASPEDFTSALHPSGEGKMRWFIFSKEQLLTTDEGKDIPDQIDFILKRKIYVGTLAGQHVFAGEAEELQQIPPGLLWSNLRALFGILSEEYYAIAGRAMQLLSWDRLHQYCGSCGSAMCIRETERCRECLSCGHLAFPKLAPAIMALVKRENKILLARGPHFPEKCYSVLAGYVDPGETLEQCVTREVLEEVGVKVKNVCYFGSQPWPFSQSLMVAFTCDWEEGEISIDPLELTDAGWFDHTNLPQLPPRLSMARMLIDASSSINTGRIVF